MPTEKSPLWWWHDGGWTGRHAASQDLGRRCHHVRREKECAGSIPTLEIVRAHHIPCLLCTLSS